MYSTNYLKAPEYTKDVQRSSVREHRVQAFGKEPERPEHATPLALLRGPRAGGRASPAGRAFTCVYALLGTTIIISALSPFVESLLDAVRAWLNHFVPLAVDTSDDQ